MTSPRAFAAAAVETAGTVNPEPSGPKAPEGGWHIAYADGFGATLGSGTGQDSTWYPNRFSEKPAGEEQPGFNSNELEVFDSSQVKAGSEGLELSCTYRAGKKYLCGAATTANGNKNQKFRWKPGGGETWAFEVDAKLPKNSGEADPGWWSSDYAWTDEFDYFEFWGWNT